MAANRPVPGTPRVISPSPTLQSDTASGDDYFPPVTRSAVRRSTRIKAVAGIAEDDVSSGSDLELSRARSRSRSVDASMRRRRLSGMASMKPKTPSRNSASMLKMANGDESTNGHLSPSGSTFGEYWRGISRSPSPLGLIPIHKSWRSFVHRHEIPRKALHVSIGFLTLGLYAYGFQTSSIHPVLLSLLVPIALVDILRMNWPPFNRLYVRIMGAFMRESEVHDRYNGVIWYLLGTWTAMRFFPKDVAVMSVILLSWCDTAASTVGRAWGRYTPRVRKGKSLAGTLAAATVGTASALLWWGYFAPRYETQGIADNSSIHAFAFQGALSLPSRIKELLGWTADRGVITGGTALGVMSAVAGLVASASEAVDVFGLDDNITIPVLCGVGLWGFLRLFGAA